MLWIAGDIFHAAPNIDHSQDFVRNDVKRWLNWLRNNIGYDGWRLDFVRSKAILVNTRYIFFFSYKPVVMLFMLSLNLFIFVGVSQVDMLKNTLKLQILHLPLGSIGIVWLMKVVICATTKVTFIFIFLRYHVKCHTET